MYIQCMYIQCAYLRYIIVIIIVIIIITIITLIFLLSFFIASWVDVVRSSSRSGSKWRSWWPRSPRKTLKEAKARSEKTGGVPWRDLDDRWGNLVRGFWRWNTGERYEGLYRKRCWICENGHLAVWFLSPQKGLFWVFWMLRWEEGQN